MNYNLDFEKSVLSALKYDNSAIDRIELVSADFYDKKNREIFQVMHYLIHAGHEANDITIYDALQNINAKVPIAYIAGLEPITAANITYYADGVKECSRRRKLARLSLQIQDGLEKAETIDVIEIIEKELTNISETHVYNIRWLKEIMLSAIEDIEKMYKLKGELSGVPSGFSGIDRITNGFQPGDLIIIGARPSIGKTAIALTMAGYITVRKKKTAGFFSCEMSAKQLTGRLLASEGRINLSNVRSGYLKESDFAKIMDASNQISAAPLLIDDTPNISLSELKSKARLMKRKGAEILFVDYLTLIKHGDTRMPRHERVGEVSKSLKQLARELDVPIIAMSQVGREAEGKMPTLANLRQSGEVEEDSDIVMFLHRDRLEAETDLCIAKNRNGATETIPLMFLTQYVKFVEMTTRGNE